MHDTLEWLYNDALKGTLRTLDETLVKYTEEWTQDDFEKFIIVKKQFVAKDYYNKGIQFLIDYYVEHTPFKDGTIELEKQVNLKLGGHNIVGFIDRISINPKTGNIEIHDYKTANALPPQSKMDKDRQLALYSIAIKELMGTGRDIKLVWHYLAHKTRIVSTRTDKELEQLKLDILDLIAKIETTADFPTHETVLCHWCEYKSMCPLWNKDIKRVSQTSLTDIPAQKEISQTNTQDNNNYPTTSRYFKN